MREQRKHRYAVANSLKNLSEEVGKINDDYSRDNNNNDDDDNSANGEGE